MENQATSNLSSEKKLTVNTHFCIYMCNTINVSQTPSAFLHVCCLVWRPKIVCILGFDVPLLVAYVVNVSLHPKTVIMLDIFIIKLKVMVIYSRSNWHYGFWYYYYTRYWSLLLYCTLYCLCLLLAFRLIHLNVIGLQIHSIHFQLYLFTTMSVCCTSSHSRWLIGLCSFSLHSPNLWAQLL